MNVTYGAGQPETHFLLPGACRAHVNGRMVTPVAGQGTSDPAGGCGGVAMAGGR